MIREEMNKVEISKNRKDQWNQIFFSWKDKIDKPLARLTEKKWEMAQMNKIRNEQNKKQNKK